MSRILNIVLYTEGLPFHGHTIAESALGGAESAFLYLARELVVTGHKVKAFCNCPAPGNYDGVAYSDVSKFNDWRTKEECDVFICSRFYAVFQHAIPARFKTLWLHDHLNPQIAGDLKRFLPHIDILYCVSQYHVQYTQQFFPEVRDKFKILSNGVDLELIKSVLAQQREKKHKIMFTSRPERGLQEALMIYEQLGDKTLEFLACSYPYPNEDVEQPYTAVIQQLIKIGFPVRFQQFNKKELYENIAESKVVIYPANTPEIFCIAAVEAQACRTVFLGRSLGAIQETVGYPSQKEINPLLFLQATKQVLESDNFRMTLEQLGWQHIQRYDWKNTAKQLEQHVLQFFNQPKTQDTTDQNPDELPNVLILTPVKNAIPFLSTYFANLAKLTFPAANISLGFLEGDSNDGTYEALEKMLPALRTKFRKVGLWKKDFGFLLPPGMHRAENSIQHPRRVVLAKSRNHLLFHALDDEDWALWIDVDVIDFPPDIIQQLLAANKPIVTPNCVLQYGGRSFDLNAWRDKATVFMHDLRREGDLVKLDAVGGCMLLIHADVHRDGLIFPAYPYGVGNDKVRENSWGTKGELETEGLGIMAHDMGIQPWGMPNLEIKHRNG